MTKHRENTIKIHTLETISCITVLQQEVNRSHLVVFRVGDDSWIGLNNYSPLLHYLLYLYCHVWHYIIYLRQYQLTIPNDNELEDPDKIALGSACRREKTSQPQNTELEWVPLLIFSRSTLLHVFWRHTLFDFLKLRIWEIFTQYHKSYFIIVNFTTCILKAYTIWCSQVEDLGNFHPKALKLLFNSVHEFCFI